MLGSDFALKMKCHFVLGLGLSSLLTFCAAHEVCDQRRPIKTPAGALVETHCTSAKGVGGKSYLTLAGRTVLEDQSLFEASWNKVRSIWVYAGRFDAATGCPSRLYLMDLSLQAPKVLTFGVAKACNEFHWASWGAKRSVIALKNNVKFTYENGKMTLPASGEKLWKAIEPPHAGAGLNLEDALAFSEDVPLPK
jgi:hypothetical protein